MSAAPDSPGSPTRIEDRGGRPQAIRLQRFVMRVVEGADRGAEALLSQNRLRIGTAPSNELRLTDEFASRLHAEVSVEADGFRLVDLGSRNGTLLGAHRVTDVFLKTGDRIRVGRTTLVFEAMDETVRLPLAEGATFGELEGESVAMRRVFEVLARIAPTDATVLLHGETGTGKEEAARAPHAAIGRAKGPFLVADCGAIPGTLLTTELFGHERGAFTGAVHSRPGLFERASGGTLLLDEVGELALDLQPQLLRVLERHEIQRLGGDTITPVDVRVLAATNRDLRRDVNAGRFRADLYFRLAVVEVTLPALRDRIEDLPRLVARLHEDACARTGVEASPPSEEEIQQLSRHFWHGNVRELRNQLERRVLFGAGLDITRITPAEPPAGAGGAALPYREAKAAVVDRFERGYVEDLLARTGGNVSKAAREGRMDRTHLIELIKKHGLRDPSHARK